MVGYIGCFNNTVMVLQCSGDDVSNVTLWCYGIVILVAVVEIE